MIKAGILSAILGLALAAGLSSAERTDFSNELESSEIAKAERYANSLPDVDGALRVKLPHNEDPEENMKVVKELLESVNRVLHSSKSGALKMLASLEDANECNQKSFRILAKNQIAAYSVSDKMSKTRITGIFNHYMQRHAQNCGAYHSQAYRTKKTQVPHDSLSRVEAAFGNMRQDDFILWLSDSQTRAFLQKSYSPMIEDSGSDVRRKIVRNVIEKVKESPEDFDSVKPQVDPKSAKASLPKPTKIFEQYIYKPCADYEKVLGDDLSAARIDAIAVKDSSNFMEDSRDLYKAIVQSRFCKLALGEKSKMTKLLTKMWERELPRHL